MHGSGKISVSRTCFMRVMGRFSQCWKRIRQHKSVLLLLFSHSVASWTLFPSCRRPWHDSQLSAKRRQRPSSSSDEEDMNRWYDSVDDNATPDDIFWEEMERQNSLLNNGNSNPYEPPGASSTVSSSSSSSGSEAAGATLDSINISRQQLQSSPEQTEKIPITPKAAEATLMEYDVYRVADNWLDEEIIEAMTAAKQKDDWDDSMPSLEEQIEAWEAEEEDEETLADMQNDQFTDEPWDHWGEPSDDTDNDPDAPPRIDVSHPSLRDHILTLDNIDEYTEEEQEAERSWLERISSLQIKSARLERARDNPKAKAFFAREPDAMEYDTMWVSAIDNVCFKNLVGIFRDYGVQFADNFGDFADTVISDGLASIEDVASFKARQVYNVTGLPCIASRTSFEVEPVPERDGSTSAGRSVTEVMKTNPRVTSGYRFNDIGMHVEYIVEALEQFSEPTRVTRFKTCLCFYDGTTEFYEYGMCDCDMIFCNTLRTFIPMSAAINEMLQTCILTFDLEYQKWLRARLDKVATASTAQVKLRDRVLKEAKVLPNDIVDVSAFMDSMVDVNLMDACAKDLSQLVMEETRPTKLLTVATTGLVLALPMAKYLQVPCVYARKERNVVMASTYTASYSSKTVGKNRELIVAKSHIQPEDRILIVDDFLSSGASQEALLRIISDAGATAVGVAVLLEKVYESGRQSLSGYNIPVFSICRIASVKSGVIQLMEEDGYINIYEDDKASRSASKC